MTDLEIHAFLKSIYNSKADFEVVISNRKTKKRLGTYMFNNHRIIIYAWLIHRLNEDIKEVAIHEYAHHIHHSELKVPGVYERPHGLQFWKTYSALMCRAISKGIYEDDYVVRVFKD